MVFLFPKNMTIKERSYCSAIFFGKTIFSENFQEEKTVFCAVNSVTQHLNTLRHSVTL